MRIRLGLAAIAAVLAPPSAALAWGYEGHEIVAEIARAFMTPATLAKVDSILATDVSNSLTPHDMASEATWADAYRGAGHRETASWHFVDLEITGADLKAACVGFPPAPNPASSGPANDCIVDKLSEFEAELSSPQTSPKERLLALKFVLHFVGDIHQPLHASDNQDRGGNCVQVSLGGVRTTNLHSYWDTAVVQALGSDPVAVAKALIAKITPAEAKAWSSGGPMEWAMESYGVARSAVYTVGSKPGCNSSDGPVSLPAGYSDAANKAAALQLEKAGVRLAMVLNRALG